MWRTFHGAGHALKIIFKMIEKLAFGRPKVLFVRLIGAILGPLSLILLPSVTVVSVAGSYIAAWSIAVVLSALVRFGVEHYILSNTPIMRGSPVAAMRLLKKELTRISALYLSFFIAIGLYGENVFSWIKGGADADVVTMALFCSFLFSSVWVLSSALRAVRYLTASVCTEAVVAPFVFVCGVLFLGHAATLELLLFLQAFGLLCSVVFGAGLLKLALSRGEEQDSLVEPDATSRVAIGAVSSSGLALIWLPNILVDQKFGPAFTADFAAAARSGALVSFGLVVANSVLAPTYSMLRHSGDRLELWSLYRSARRLQVPYVLAGLVVVFSISIWSTFSSFFVLNPIATAIVAIGWGGSALLGPINTVAVHTERYGGLVFSNVFSILFFVSFLYVVDVSSENIAVYLALTYSAAIFLQKFLLLTIWAKRYAPKQR